MPIIINEFEIVSPEGEQPGERAGLQLERRQGLESLRPEDVERIMRRFYLRRIRLWAN